MFKSDKKETIEIFIDYLIEMKSIYKDADCKELYLKDLSYNMKDEILKEATRKALYFIRDEVIEYHKITKRFKQ